MEPSDKKSAKTARLPPEGSGQTPARETLALDKLVTDARTQVRAEISEYIVGLSRGTGHHRDRGGCRAEDRIPGDGGERLLGGGTAAGVRPVRSKDPGAGPASPARRVQQTARPAWAGN